MKKMEYTVRAVTTKKTVPKVFDTKEEVEKHRLKHADPDHWEVVKREVVYGDWELETTI